MKIDADMVSTAQAAKALGVGVSTVKRWVDDGVLPAFKTAGGHRKLCLADLLRLAKEQRLPHVDLQQLPLFVPIRGHADADALYELLRAGEARAAAGMIRASYLDGGDLGTLADRLIQPAMARIGADWAAGRIDIFHEHRASQICTEAVLGLKSLLDRRGGEGDAPLAVGGSPQSHWHSLANFLAEAVLLEAGWRVVNFGPNTPMPSFRKAIEELRPRLVWLSISPLDDPVGFLDEYRRLFEEARRLDVAVAVGGLGLTQELRVQMPYTTFGDGLAHLAAFARSLYPCPKPRARGRPPRKRQP